MRPIRLDVPLVVGRERSVGRVPALVQRAVGGCVAAEGVAVVAAGEVLFGEGDCA